MKVVILAGGMGTRLNEQTEIRPKPLVEIGNRPILWHVMQHYAHHGFTEFVVALGYKGEAIKRYFLDYYALGADMTVRLKDGKVEMHTRECDDWTVHLIDTGLDVMTGGRLKRLEPMLGGDTFMLTYGDGVSNVDLKRVLEFHKMHKKLATVTAVRPPARFGGLRFAGDMIAEFTEKPQIGEGWINGGFMVLEPGVLDYLKRGDKTVLEADTLEELARVGELAAYRHDSFWQCMDTMRDVKVLEGLWQGGDAPWKTWR